MNDKTEKVYRFMIVENSITILACAIAIAGIAIGTNSLHCLWGLLLLINLTHFTPPKVVKNNE